MTIYIFCQCIFRTNSLKLNAGLKDKCIQNFAGYCQIPFWTFISLSAMPQSVCFLIIYRAYCILLDFGEKGFSVTIIFSIEFTSISLWMIKIHLLYVCHLHFFFHELYFHLFSPLSYGVDSHLPWFLGYFHWYYLFVV